MDIYKKLFSIFVIALLIGVAYGVGYSRGVSTTIHLVWDVGIKFLKITNSSIQIREDEIRAALFQYHAQVASCINGSFVQVLK